MRIFNSVDRISPKNGSCVTIGNFDGVHLGHQALIGRAREIALANGLDFILITFWPHPRLALANSPGHKALSSRAQRLGLLARSGAENIIELPFTPEIANLSAADFTQEKLLPLNMRQLVVGHDFTMGKNRQGDVDFLRELAKKWNFALDQAPAFMNDGAPVSSTRLRRDISAGNVEDAAILLGRFYQVCGKVVHGEGRGAKLGFPTANLGYYEVLLPGNGVYATFADCDGKRFQAVTNIGNNPTFNGGKTTVESFLLDCESNLYGKELCLEFVSCLRGEITFDSPAALAAQIDADVSRARIILQTAASHD